MKNMKKNSMPKPEIEVLEIKKGEDIIRTSNALLSSMTDGGADTATGYKTYSLFNY